MRVHYICPLNSHLLVIRWRQAKGNIALSKHTASSHRSVLTRLHVYIKLFQNWKNRLCLLLCMYPHSLKQFCLQPKKQPRITLNCNKQDGENCRTTAVTNLCQILNCAKSWKLRNYDRHWSQISLFLFIFVKPRSLSSFMDSAMPKTDIFWTEIL